MTYRMAESIVGLAALLVLASAGGCTSGKGTGALGGAGVGALIGQLAGRNTASTLVGAGVGAGVGYLIGDHADKAEAEQRHAVTPEEMTPLSGTAWRLISVDPPVAEPEKSLVTRFRPDGVVTTARTYEDGRLEVAEESYRVVGRTLIVNRPDYVVNAEFRLEGDRLYITAGGRRAVLTRT